MKLSLAAALAHRPRLLVLDEATGGLDPVARDGILDLLNDFTRDETHTVLLSSHILSDLEKICDYVAFLRNGRLLFCEEKDRRRPPARAGNRRAAGERRPRPPPERSCRRAARPP